MGNGCCEWVCGTRRLMGIYLGRNACVSQSLRRYCHHTFISHDRGPKQPSVTSPRHPLACKLIELAAVSSRITCCVTLGWDNYALQTHIGVKKTTTEATAARSVSRIETQLLRVSVGKSQCCCCCCCCETCGLPFLRSRKLIWSTTRMQTVGLDITVCHIPEV